LDSNEGVKLVRAGLVKVLMVGVMVEERGLGIEGLRLWKVVVVAWVAW
jgi:hypothetical protein